MLSCKTYRPSPQLENHIQSLFLYEHENDSDGTSMQRLTPDGHVEINFSLDAPMKRKNSDGTSFIQNNYYLTSRFSNHYFVQPTGCVRMIGMRFFPWGIRPFIEVPASEIA